MTCPRLPGALTSEAGDSPNRCPEPDGCAGRSTRWATNGAAHSHSSPSNSAASSKRLPIPLADGHREDHPGSIWSTRSDARAKDQKIRGVLGHETSLSQPQYVGAAVWAVIGGHEVVSDQQREGEHAAGLDVALVGAEGAEQ